MKNKPVASNVSNCRISRRDFLAAAGAVTAFMFVPGRVLGLDGETPPNNKLNIAGIGIGGQGGADLDEMDKKILLTIIDRFNGGPVGASSLAVAVGEDVGTLEEVYEPFLVQQGLIQRTSRGRIAQKRAYDHFSRKTANDHQSELDLG